MSFAPSNPVDRPFWLIILTSWPMQKVEELAKYAADCERSVSWDHEAKRPRFGGGLT